jgi:hypothetical protein
VSRSRFVGVRDFFNRVKGAPMTPMKVNNHAAAALKAERERDKMQAMRDYEAETLACQANMVRLRALRLAKESAEAQATTARRPGKKKATNRLSVLTPGCGPTRKSS